MLTVSVIIAEGIALTVLSFFVLTGKEARAKVREIFWIHTSGLLIAREGRASMEGVDYDIFTSMLTAVVDFIRDSFSRIDPTAVQKIEFGRLRLYVERGEYSYLVAIYEGDYVKPMVASLKDAIRLLELGYSPVIQDKVPDLSESDAWEQVVESVLEIEEFETKEGEGND